MAFAISSVASALLIGVAMGNIVWGIPLNDRYDFQGNFLNLLHPYSLFVGITTVALFAMHTNLYLILKNAIKWMPGWILARKSSTSHVPGKKRVWRSKNGRTFDSDRTTLRAAQ